jgi:hypothetical protein
MSVFVFRGTADESVRKLHHMLQLEDRDVSGLYWGVDAGFSSLQMCAWPILLTDLLCGGKF